MGAESLRRCVACSTPPRTTCRIPARCGVARVGHLAERQQVTRSTNGVRQWIMRCPPRDSKFSSSRSHAAEWPFSPSDPDRHVTDHGRRCIGLALVVVHVNPLAQLGPRRGERVPLRRLIEPNGAQWSNVAALDPSRCPTLKSSMRPLILLLDRTGGRILWETGAAIVRSRARNPRHLDPKLRRRAHSPTHQTRCWARHGTEEADGSRPIG